MKGRPTDDCGIVIPTRRPYASTGFIGICKDMRELCPAAWIMNFTNPMSFVCTYLNRYGGIQALGFCHQAHGSMGVVAEMLGFEPGELQSMALDPMVRSIGQVRKITDAFLRYYRNDLPRFA